ncbi:TIGR02234 family membrane protein [Corynebacterium breve]|uniref:TIGR02234 family membrane protein n=1 Tax=Corynebacterium breve TaxID=3049799 RepID=A0ABY8VDV5_9CORY|nr:TIGR02234 family membrane protein [Corynebacterium breve]WIM66925.1 TIGR02234 family membrane protein [Corynebacterium breve]
MDKKYSRIGALLLGIGALIMWAGSSVKWMGVDYFDDKSGDGYVAVSGGSWSTEVVAVILLLLAGMIAGFVVRRWGRRVIGAVSAIAAAGAAISPIMLLVTTPDEERVKSLLTAGATSQRANDPVTIAEWAEITNVQVASLGPLVTVLGAVVAIIGGVVMALRPGTDSANLNKYETAATRRKKIADDLESSPDSGRVMWDALDADIDPTDEEKRDTDIP